MKLNNITPDEKTLSVLRAAYRAWCAASDLRSRRERHKRYTYGRQWDDLVTDAAGNTMTEGELARRSGKRPMSNNLIRQLVKSIVGRFRNNIADERPPTNIEMLNKNNSLAELDSRALEEFLISGCAIQRVVYERRLNGDGVWVDNVNPTRFFINAIEDPRSWDIELVGMLHDMNMAEVIMRFAHNDRNKADRLREIYADNATILPDSICEKTSHNEFFHARQGRCRVFEVWTLECQEQLRCHDTARASIFIAPLSQEEDIDKENALRRKSGTPLIVTRWEVATRWHCRYISPTGALLDEFDSPYPHGSHPFIVKFHPLTDGEVHSFVEDVIDQQRYINRLIVLIDHIMSTSAKGALLFPKEQKDPQFTWEEIAQAWASCDSIIPYNPQEGVPGPQQLITKNTDIGAYDLLSLEMKLLEDVSGVSDALLGKNISAATGTALYENQVRNATIALADIFETFNAFRSARDSKALNS